jgi:Immunity protein Imm1
LDRFGMCTVTDSLRRRRRTPGNLFEVGATVSWNGGQKHIENESQLLTLLDELDQSQLPESPDMADILPDGSETTLTIGLGRDETVLSLTPVSGDPPHFAGKGDPAAQGFVVFFYGGSYSEFPRSYAIPKSIGRQVAAAFVASGGQRPTAIHWEEV